MGLFSRNKKDEQKQLEQAQALNDANNLPETNNVPEIDPRTECLNDTRVKLSKLKTFCAFFNNEILDQIYEQSLFICNIFEKNKDLNYRKLDQYSYYYTDNLIVMLNNLKKGREENIIILLEKIEMHKKKLEDIKPIEVNTKFFENEKKKWAVFMGLELARTYRELSGFEKPLANKPLAKDINFISKFQSADYYVIPKEKFDPLTDYNIDDCYMSTVYTIQRKLMGKLNKALFSIIFDSIFSCGNDLFFYLFKISDTSDMFIYIPHKMAFKLVQSTDIIPLKDTYETKWEKVKMDSQAALEKIEKDKIKLDEQKKIVETEILATLTNYLNKINETELLNSLNAIDIDRRALDEILKLQRLDI